ncbi:uncharacterized protein LOC128954850 [Oppia nitens]|uniref:uncharacterized protein LOC128954850 n=1 Tax=Oppia nitens TaxID=1686743 RepID=UPI0023DA36C8|nr:uncharacterized protein LOC128954850 [Oppia nitens]
MHFCLIKQLLVLCLVGATVVVVQCLPASQSTSLLSSLSSVVTTTTTITNNTSGHQPQHRLVRRQDADTQCNQTNLDVEACIANKWGQSSKPSGAPTLYTDSPPVPPVPTNKLCCLSLQYFCSFNKMLDDKVCTHEKLDPLIQKDKEMIDNCRQKGIQPTDQMCKPLEITPTAGVSEVCNKYLCYDSPSSGGGNNEAPAQPSSNSTVSSTAATSPQSLTITRLATVGIAMMSTIVTIAMF